MTSNDSSNSALKADDRAGLPDNVLDFLVVGIGASAGGIPALLSFFEHVPADIGMAFVLVLHLSPDHSSHVDEVLQRVARMPVTQVFSSTRIEKNHVYLISPANDLTIANGYLHADQDERPRGRPVAIDLLFRSLAEAQGSRAVSIILSGTGSDGASGIARIKEQAGITIVQDPEDAEYPEMPLSAIATGSVDIVLPVADIPGKLVELWNNARVIHLPFVTNNASVGEVSTSDPSVAAEQALREVLDLLRTRTGHDFQHYKRATVLRRVERRLQVNSLADLPAYKHFIEKHPEETTALLKDMLIGVTNFFRDRSPFAALEHDILPKILQGKTSADRTRVWIAGCSSGEEAYSLGMLLTELTEEREDRPALQLFASDIDEHAIQIGRIGTYAESILTDVTQARVDRFFNHSPGRYAVTQALRDNVLFAKHNVLRDPPFSQLDLVSCRNLLIYLDRTVQRKVLETFHFALQPSGYLFLGSSESAEIANDLFTAVDNRNRIFKVNSFGARPRPALPFLSLSAPVVRAPATEDAPVRRPTGFFSSLHERVLKRAGLPSLIVDKAYKILHSSAEVGRYLSHVGGEPSQNLLTLINPQLRLELRSALSEAQANGIAAETSQVRFAYSNALSYVNMSVQPFRDFDAPVDVLLVSFDERQNLRTGGLRLLTSGESGGVTLSQNEVLQLKEQLQSTIEHANVSTEELKASNEELQALNEELLSAAEELETGKEELQSVNEELVTVNEELRTKVQETAKAVDDLENLIVSTGIATIFVDRAMRIKRFTAPAVELFNLIDSDIGRPLFDLTHRLNYPQLAADATATFETLNIIEREVSTTEGNWFLARFRPYRTSDDHIDGAVLTLFDITARRSAEHDARSSEDRLKLAALTTDDYAIIVQAPDGSIVSWNKGAERVFGYEECEVLGKSIDVIYLPEDCVAGVALSERIRATSQGRAEDGRWHVRRDGERIYCSGVTTPLHARSFDGYAKILRDLTEHQVNDNKQQLQLASERMERANAEASIRVKDEIFAKLSHAQQSLLHAATHDELTGLHNRAYITRLLNETIDRSSLSQGGLAAVLYIDLDGFKLVNDSLGHPAGDKVLVEVSARLARCIRSGDALARMSGDEFIVLVTDAADDGALESLAQRIKATFSEPLPSAFSDIFVSCSIGIVRLSKEYGNAGDVLRDADAAMYAAKRSDNDSGSGTFMFFKQAMREEAMQAMSLQSDLRHATLTEAFEIHYQPIFEAQTRQITGVEALIRWTHEKRGAVSPTEFIPVAEQIGVIPAIDRWVRSTSFKQISAWKRTTPSLTLCLNVNVSASELRDPLFLPSLEQLALASDFRLSDLQIELTEGVLLDDSQRTSRLLSAIREKGIRIALDDFGTGYSSLAYIDRYQIDTLKIDRSFVARMLHQPRTMSILKSIVYLGKQLELDIVAEGVESEQQFDALVAMGCDSIQGFLLCRPLPATAIGPLIVGAAGVSCA